MTVLACIFRVYALYVELQCEQIWFQIMVRWCLKCLWFIPWYLRSRCCHNSCQPQLLLFHIWLFDIKLILVFCMLGSALRLVIQAYKREEEMNGNSAIKTTKRRRDPVQVWSVIYKVHEPYLVAFFCLLLILTFARLKFLCLCKCIWKKPEPIPWIFGANFELLWIIQVHWQ